MSDRVPREVLVRSISERVQAIGHASERLGHVFADRQALHPTDFRALSSIYQAERGGTPFTAKALAQELELSPAAITYVVERLVNSGHVRRERDPADGRRVILRYAEPGRRVAAGFFGPLGIAHAEALEGFDEAELEAAARVLEQVVETLESFQERVRRSGAKGVPA